MFLYASLCFGLMLPGVPQRQTIDARHGDLVIVPPNADVKVVRRGEAQVRAIFEAAQRSLVLLVDYVDWDGHEPDNRVDVSYRFYNVEGEWPLGRRWDGRAVVEDYQLLGGAVTSAHGLGLRTAGGLVQLLSGVNPRSADLFAQRPAMATLSYKGGGRTSAGALPFDQAEAREAEVTIRTAERLAQSGAAGGSGVTFLVNGVAAGSPSGSPSPYPPPGAPVRVGGNIRTPQRIVDAAPVMPEVARQAGIRGVVILEIIIGVDGKVTDAKVLRSIPLLDQAAIDAARQWRYEPTLLNNAPVPVIMTATVSFQ